MEVFVVGEGWREGFSGGEGGFEGGALGGDFGGAEGQGAAVDVVATFAGLAALLEGGRVSWGGRWEEGGRGAERRMEDEGGEEILNVGTYYHLV